MGRFRSPASQARYVVGQKLAIGRPSHGQKGQDGRIHSLGTARTYEDSLTGVAAYIANQQVDTIGRGLASLTPEIAQNYLEMRSEQVGQKQLDKDRQAIQVLLGSKLPVIKSELDQVHQSRAYTREQIQLIAGAQSRLNSLATKIAANAGLRAHELLTLMPLSERKVSSHRTWSEERFEGRADVRMYSVTGKGGLTREVAIDAGLAAILEAVRLSEPRQVTDRKIYYAQYYDLAGGKRWSDSFSKASLRELGWSSGAHGVRHTYAQERMRALQGLGYLYDVALGIVSQEMGHFRPDISEVYLR